MYSRADDARAGLRRRPALPVVMHTDAIWRACRIILDVRLHRGEIDDRRGDRLHGRAHQLRAGQRRGRGALVHVPPDVPAVVPARADAAAPAARRRAGAARRRVLAQGFHDTLLRNGSLPISFHRRLLAGEGAEPACSSSRPSTSRAVARGSSTGRARRPASARRPTDRNGSSSASSRRARGSSTSSTSRARGPAARPASTPSARSRRASAVPLQLAGGIDSAEAIQLAFAAGATRVVLTTAIADRPDDLACLPRDRR